MGGPEGIVESMQIMKEGKASASEAVDCKWYIRAPPRSKVSVQVKPRLDSSLGKCLHHALLSTNGACLERFKRGRSYHFVLVLTCNFSPSSVIFMS